MNVTQQNMKSIKEIYNLSYDNSNFNSGLINWYNRMVDKSYNELDVTDISKMLRQGILKDIALKRAVDLFLINPYDGEFNDGDLINTIVSHNYSINNEVKNSELRELLNVLQSEYIQFDWDNEYSKNMYFNNIKKFLSLIS